VELGAHPAEATLAAYRASTGSPGPGAGAGGAGATTSVTGFIVLTDLSGLQVHADFAETDAAKVKVGAAGSVTVNALPNDSFSAKVIQIDPTSTTNNSVVQYGVMLALSQQVRGLRPGQTASVSVITAQADNALTVPSSAVSTAGGQNTVTVVGANGAQRTVQVTVGVKGDSTTQILSGLSVGEKVVTSSGASGFPSGGFPIPGGRLGGLGGGLGGGG
jgi:macrolide-specific efflux system membrane fusion protein